MKKQFTKIKIAAENLSRSNKHDRKDFELETIEKQVEKYRDVLDKMVRKLPAVSSTTDTQERDKRIKKNSHYKIGVALEESAKELSKDMPLHHVLSNCGELEKSLAECIVDSELETEMEVVRRLKLILDNEIQEISTLKRNVTRTVQEYTSLKRSYEAAIRLDEPQSKINHIKEQQEQCEVKLEKDRDSWAAQMFELIAKEDVIVECIRDYVLNQRNYHERALQRVNSSLANIQDIIQSTVKSRFGTSLTEHLASTDRQISYIIELCVCCLVENGLCEEGLLRVGCASTKLRRMKRALEAQYVKTPLPLDYQDPHVIGSILKLYLRELPEPLLTYKFYKDFISAAERGTEAERKADIKATLEKLPTANYANLRYLTRFLWLVTQHVDQNKMSSQNLAIVLSPNMLWPRTDKSNPADYMGQVNSSSAVNVIVELLISQWEYFFEGEVDFFVTLQRNKLFVEGKSKSNSSNENLDRQDGESSDSPRYGTIRRQKPNAPSPPAKTYESVRVHNASNNTNDTATVQQKNGELTNQRMKELFTAPAERPEKPPPPKQLQLQLQSQPQLQASQQHATHTGPEQAPMQPPPQPPQPPKPVPMTRTQFFGLDNLPSPVADRKSSDSANSLTFKPDLPQKPKLPKRPMVLGLNTGGKSDDEGATSAQNAEIASEDDDTRSQTERFIDRLRAENCDNGNSSKEHNHSHNHNHDTNEQLPETERTAFTNPILTNANPNANANANVNANIPVTHTTASGSSGTSAGTDKLSGLPAPEQVRPTPTTPVSPNMITTPKRPTVPAPPPPTIVKKPAE